MAAFQTKANSGSLFKNDRRTTDSHPNAKGKALIGGRWYWVSAWTKSPNGGGDKFQSLSFQEMTAEQADKYGGHQSAGGGSGDDMPGSTSIPRSAPPRRPQAPARQPLPADAPFGDDQQFDPDSIPF